MIDVLLIRHGPTAWNARGRIQGHRDIRLSRAGRAELAARRIPPQYRQYRWYASPLARAVESARLLGARDLRTDARLVELDWGSWEGWTRDALRAHYGQVFAENEARGLEFRPPGGESPRELRRRLRAWLADMATGGQGVIAVTHKGVIQMALAMATGWDLVSRAPVRLDWGCAQHFRVISSPLDVQLTRSNVPLGVDDAALGPGDGEVDREGRR